MEYLNIKKDGLEIEYSTDKKVEELFKVYMEIIKRDLGIEAIWEAGIVKVEVEKEQEKGVEEKEPEKDKEAETLKKKEKKLPKWFKNAEIKGNVAWQEEDDKIRIAYSSGVSSIVFERKLIEKVLDLPEIKRETVLSLLGSNASQKYYLMLNYILNKYPERYDVIEIPIYGTGTFAGTVKKMKKELRKKANIPFNPMINIIPFKSYYVYCKKHPNSDSDIPLEERCSEETVNKETPPCEFMSFIYKNSSKGQCLSMKVGQERLMEVEEM